MALRNGDPLDVTVDAAASTVPEHARLPSTTPLTTMPSVEAEGSRENAAEFTPMVGVEELPREHLADPLVGRIVANRYRILTPIGRGGMGVVYKVEHIHLGKMLAMKLLAGELSMSAEVVRRFKREALTVSRLSSPSTVHVFDYGVDAGLTYIVMELVTGRDLAALLLAEGPMPFSRLGKIVMQILSSLGEAHAKGIIHRDVKPQNVMIATTADKTDVAKVLDFGIAKLREDADMPDVTRRDQLIGTPYFIAPELIRGDAVDHRSDLYAVGVLMYQALTGHYPFVAKNSAAVLVKHVTEKPIKPSSKAPGRGIPPGADAIVLRALDKDPAARWQTAEALQDAIVAELRSLGTSHVDELLDARAIEKLTRAALADSIEGPLNAIASRDEVEGYERKLRSRRHLVAFALSMAVIAAAGVGLAFVVRARQTRFEGVEIEPNDNPASATPLPLNQEASAQLGKRLDAAHSDRDFYAFTIPKSSNDRESIAQLVVTALPNMTMCTLLYREGFHQPIAQYCVGHEARELSIPRLRLEPGRYYASVLQDLDPRGERRAPFVQENVSDPYTIKIALAEAPNGQTVEIEPNDSPNAAHRMRPGETVSGAIGWIDDEDVYCAEANGKAIRWTAKDVVRDAGSVLEVTPLRGREALARVLVHAAGTGPMNAENSRSPWTSTSLASEPETTRCLRVRLARDPWVDDAPRLPSGASEMYSITLDGDP